MRGVRHRHWPVVDSPSELARVLTNANGFQELVFKPVAGVHGRGILVLRWEGTLFTDPHGAQRTPEDLFAHARSSDWSDWMIQERVFPHKRLVALAGSSYLQALRFVSYRDRDGKVQIPIVWLRIIAGNSRTDNFGRVSTPTGNLVGTVDTATGRLKYVLGPRESKPGLIERVCHPTTNAVFADFTVPLFAEAKELVLKAAHAFAPLRTVGWDVAVTDDGPSLIEGNVTWGPLPTKDDLHAMVRSFR